MEKKITGVNIMQKVNGEIGVILEKSWDMGILWNKVGSYETIAELSQLIEEWYPWSVDEAELKELTEEFLENQYIDVDGEEIEFTKITPGSTPFVPAVAGYYMAYFVVNEFLK